MWITCIIIEKTVWAVKANMMKFTHHTCIIWTIRYWRQRLYLEDKHQLAVWSSWWFLQICIHPCKKKNVFTPSLVTFDTNKWNNSSYVFIHTPSHHSNAFVKKNLLFFGLLNFVQRETKSDQTEKNQFQSNSNSANRLVRESMDSENAEESRSYTNLLSVALFLLIQRSAEKSKKERQ